MTRMAGRSGRLYMGLAAAGTAEPVAFLKSWNIDSKSDRYDVTCFEDTSKTYVAGLPDSSGAFAGFYDNATVQMVTASQDGIARKWYFYPDRAVNTRYWFGTATFDINQEFPVDGPATISGTWSAATPSIPVFP